MQGTWVWSLVWEDLTCHGATKPMCLFYWARVPRASALQREATSVRSVRTTTRDSPLQQWRHSISKDKEITFLRQHSYLLKKEMDVGHICHFNFFKSHIFKREWGTNETNFQFSSVAQSCLTLWTPWIAERQASLSITISWSSRRLMPIKSVMPSSHLILFCPLLLLPPVAPSIRVFSNESTLHVR